MRKEQVPLMHRTDTHGRRNQLLTVGGATMALFATGNILGFSSVAIPTLLASTSKMNANQNDISWMASLVTVGTLVGTLMGGLTSDAIGRKKTLLLSSVFFSTGWIIIAQATEVSELLVGRILTGIASGFYSVTVQVYLCEIVEPELRGVSGSLPSFMVSIGILCIWCLGSLVDWRTVAFVCSFFPAFVFVYVFCLPESPVWLMAKGRQSDAFQSLIWLRNKSEEAEQECLRLEYLKERRNSRAKGKFSCRMCCSGRIVKPLLIGMTLFFVQQFSGSYCIIFYATLIFRYADHFINDYLETIALGFVRTFSTLIGIFLVNFLARRVLLIISGLTMCVSTGVLGVYFWFREHDINYLANNSTFVLSNFNNNSSNTNEVNVEWVPLVCLIVFMFSYSIGFGIIPWFLMVELMPSDVRGWASSIGYTFNQIFLFGAVKTFLDLVDIFDAHGTFWLYSVIVFLGVGFVIVFVPETANLHEAEIEDIFDKREEQFEEVDLDATEDDEFDVVVAESNL